MSKLSRPNIFQFMLLALISLSLIPALLLAQKRIQVEGKSRNVSLIMDEKALSEQADSLGISSFELAERYRPLGLEGIALYEETLESLAAKGDILLLPSTSLASQLIAQGMDSLAVSQMIAENSSYVSEVVPETLNATLAKNYPQAERLEIAGRIWYRYPGDAKQRPAGLRAQDLKLWQDAGWLIAYRPRNYANLQIINSDFPAVPYLIHASTDVTGHPDSLEAIIQVSQRYVTGVIEGTPQDGMDKIIAKIPNSRLFSINQDWLNTLLPEVVVDKYILAANERGARLLYVRPYTKEKMGNMIDNTEKLF
ncbi:MAG: DUF5693 family protein [Deinococcales bacterium]